MTVGYSKSCDQSEQVMHTFNYYCMLLTGTLDGAIIFEIKCMCA